MKLARKYNEDTYTWDILDNDGNVIESGLSLREAQIYCYDNDPSYR